MAVLALEVKDADVFHLSIDASKRGVIAPRGTIDICIRVAYWSDPIQRLSMDAAIAPAHHPTDDPRRRGEMD